MLIENSLINNNELIFNTIDYLVIIQLFIFKTDENIT